MEIDDLSDPFFLSAETEARWSHGGHHDIELCSIGLVERSATVGKAPATIVAGDFDDACKRLGNPHRDLLHRARDYQIERRCRFDPAHIVAAIPTEHRDIVRLGDGLTLIDGERIAEVQRPFDDAGARVVGMGPVEYSAHRGRIISVRL